MSTTNLILIALTGLFLFLYSLLINSPNQVSDNLMQLLEIIVLICSSVTVVNLLSFVLVDVWFAKNQKKETSALLRLVVSLILYTFCGGIILLILGKDVATLFTTSAFITAIIGFALQSTLGNFFSGVALSIDQPFQLGDRIIVQDQEEENVEGKVVSVTWRATTIEANSGMLIHIPNSLMSEHLLKVVPQGKSVRRSVDFLVSARVSPKQVIDTARHAILNYPDRNINLDYPLQVKLWQYGFEEDMLVTIYRVFYYPNEYRDGEMESDRAILRRIWYGLNRRGFAPEYIPSKDERYQQSLDSIELFNGLNITAKETLLEQSKTLLFDVGEKLTSLNLQPNTLFIVVEGYLTIEQKPIPENPSNFYVFSHRSQRHPSIPLRKQVRKQAASLLAQYIGPSAYDLVEKQANEINSIYWLYQNIAQEIVDKNDRREFLQFAPSAPTEQLQKGDFFGELALFLGQPLLDLEISTEVETELLAIPRRAIIYLIEQDRTLLNQIITNVISHQKNNLTNTVQTLNTQGRGFDSNYISETMYRLLG